MFNGELIAMLEQEHNVEGTVMSPSYDEIGFENGERNCIEKRKCALTKNDGGKKCEKK